MNLIQLQRLAQKLKKRVSNWRGTSGQIYFEHRVAQYRRLWQQLAVDLDAELIELAPDLWEIRRGERRSRINNYLLQLDDPVTLNLAGRKPLVHQLLQREGLPVPAHAVFGLDALSTAEDFVAAHPGGCVIKPADGYGGKGVTMYITERKQVRDAAILASLYSPNLLVEAQVVGECFRLLVFDGHVLSAVRRSGLRFTGDGRTSVAASLAKAGSSLDADGQFTLRAQGLTPSTVPAEGEVVLAKNNRGADRASELRTVYDTDVTKQVHGSVSDAAQQAARCIGSRFLGVDIITVDIRRPLDEVGGCINEVNTTPALHHHYDSNTEAYPAAARTIMTSLLAITDGPNA
jgi:cyanophycin synthetase